MCFATNCGAARSARTLAGAAGSGVCRTVVKTYDGHLGDAAVIVQISPDARCGSYVIVQGAPATPGATSYRWTKPLYRAPLALTNYGANANMIKFSGKAALGGELGNMTASGTVAPGGANEVEQQ